jgi:phosphomannomutase / phosphoglucomutase
MAKQLMAKNKTSGNGIARPKNLLQSALLNSAALSIVAVLLCFGYIALIERPAISHANIEAQSQRLAESQVSLLDQALSQLQLRLTSLAENPDWLLALEEKDQQAIKDKQLELVRAFPLAVTANIIELGPMGIASLNRQKYHLRNNIEIDLLRHVSTGETVEPEAYNYQGKWLFSLATPIKASDKNHASGALLLTLDEGYLKTLLAQLDSSLGQTTLIQRFNRKEHIITTAGSNTPGDFTATAEASVSHWQIRFNPSTELIASSGQTGILIWVMLSIAIAAIVAVGFHAYSTLTRALSNDLSTLLKNRAKTSVYSLPGFAAAATNLRDKLAASAGTDATSTKTEPVATNTIEEAKPEAAVTLPETIFRAYDIRGLAEEELTDDVVYAIGLAIGSKALDQDQQSIVVSADGRHSSPRIRDAMVKGLLASGRDVIDIGTQPTPLMYFATHQLGTQSGVMITGSHNPSEYNGIKIVIDGQALSGDAIQALRERINNKDLATGEGEYQTQEITQSYIDYIINDVAIAQPLKIVIDAGNGVAGTIAPQLFEELGCEIIQLYCEVDGDFPNHHPDPSVEANLEDLKRVVHEQQADLGIAFDGDGDRLGVVTASGKSVPADRLLMLFAQDVVSRNPGADVLFDVKCTRNLNTLISNYGGRPIMWKTGHSFMKEKMAETGALLGGEFSGHIFFKERWFGFDDGIYAAARLIEILSTTDPDLDLQLEAFPDSISTAELKVETTEQQKFIIIKQLIDNADFGDGKVSTLDGVRVDYPDGWGLVRASNTTPVLVLRFEADTEEAIQRIQDQFKQQLGNLDNSLQFGF